MGRFSTRLHQIPERGARNHADRGRADHAGTQDNYNRTVQPLQCSVHSHPPSRTWCTSLWECVSTAACAAATGDAPDSRWSGPPTVLNSVGCAPAATQSLRPRRSARPRPPPATSSPSDVRPRQPATGHVASPSTRREIHRSASALRGRMPFKSPGWAVNSVPSTLPGPQQGAWSCPAVAANTPLGISSRRSSTRRECSHVSRRQVPDLREGHMGRMRPTR